MTKNSKIQLKTKYIGLALLVAVLALACGWAWQRGIFRNLETLRAFVDEAGWCGPLVTVALHLLQILVPFILGGVVLTAVVVIFGAWRGFFINFVGITLGSTLSFALARHLGQDFVRRRIKPQVWQKYFRWLDNVKLFRRAFFLLILLPFAPDDALCMLAGISKMSTRDFLLILIVAKIPMILLYSLGMASVDHLL